MLFRIFKVPGWDDLHLAHENLISVTICLFQLVGSEYYIPCLNEICQVCLNLK